MFSLSPGRVSSFGPGREASGWFTNWSLGEAKGGGDSPMGSSEQLSVGQAHADFFWSVQSCECFLCSVCVCVSAAMASELPDEEGNEQIAVRQRHELVPWIWRL